MTEYETMLENRGTSTQRGKLDQKWYFEEGQDINEIEEAELEVSPYSNADLNSFPQEQSYRRNKSDFKRLGV